MTGHRLRRGATRGRVSPYGLGGPVAVLALLLVLCPASSTSVVTDPALQADEGGSDPAAVSRLERAARAPDRTEYRGVQFVSGWTDRGASSVVVEVHHEPGVGTRVRTSWTPATRSAAITMPDSATASPAAGDTLRLLARSYRLVLGPSTRVAGRATDVVEVRRHGTGRLAARFWLDQATGLVLRREDFDDRGRTTRASAFVEVTAVRVPPAAPAAPAATGAARPSDRSATAWPEAIDDAGLRTMRAAGWDCPGELPGALQLVDARRGGATGRTVHLSYSDGLASVSLFQQRGRLDPDQLGGYRRTEVDGEPVWVLDGVPQRLAWASGGTVFVVVADAPPRTVEQVVGALPHEPADGGAWQRLGRGMDRVGSWFNPFE